MSAAAATWLHSRAALALSMTAWPADQQFKEGFETFTFGQTLRSSFEHMMAFEYRGHLANVATGLIYFLIPSALLLWATVFCYRRRWKWPAATLSVTIAAAAAPLAVLLFAWDLSRFLVWSNLAAMIVLIGGGSPALLVSHASDD